MEPAGILKQLTELDLEGIDDKQLFTLTVELEKAAQVLHAKAMVPHAAAAKRKAFRSHKYRTGPTGLAAETNLARGLCARGISQAVILVDHLPKIYHYYEMALMNRSQIDLICRFFNDRVLRDSVVRDQNFFLDYASESWPVFRTLAEGWARATRDREEDSDPAVKAFKNRKLVWAQGLDQETLGEFHMPNEMFEQFKEIVTPFYDALLREEIKEAREAAGEDPDLAPAEGEFFDLARTDSQRWLDAMMCALRRRGGLLRRLKAEAASAGRDPDDELQLDLDEADAGVAAEVIIIADQETLEREMARQAGIEVEARTAGSMAKFRCETLSGLPVSPSTALLYAQLGSFRRMVMKPDNLDFEMSRKARLFKGAKRTGVLVRDRHCKGPGCDTPARYCQRRSLRSLLEFFARAQNIGML